MSIFKRKEEITINSTRYNWRYTWHYILLLMLSPSQIGHKTSQINILN